jgi:ABC-2 type transport system permease protein
VAQSAFATVLVPGVVGISVMFQGEQWVILTFAPLACVAMAGLGLVLGTSFEPRNIGLMFGFIILPITFLGGTYYSWTRLAPVSVGGWHWLQTIVLVNPLIYVNEGMRAAFTEAPHMRRSSSTR